MIHPGISELAGCLAAAVDVLAGTAEGSALNLPQLVFGGPGLIGLSRDGGAGNREQQQGACDFECHEIILTYFCAVDAKISRR